MKKILAFAVPILVCLLLGYLAGLIQADSIREWYPTLRKPPLTPPNIVFPIAWGILYLCMGISAGLIYLSNAPQRDFLIRLFCVQLFSNFIWSYLFFYLRNPLLGMIDILTLDIFVIYYLIKSYPVSKTASVLFAPYALWVLFATYLTGYIMLTNSQSARKYPASPIRRRGIFAFYRTTYRPGLIAEPLTFVQSVIVGLEIVMAVRAMLTA